MKRSIMLTTLLGGVIGLAGPARAQLAAVANVEVVKAEAKKDEKPADNPAEKPADEKPKPETAQVEAVVTKLAEAVGLTMVAEAAPEDANQWVALEKQFSDQFRPLLLGQLHFTRVVCKPTDQEFQQIRTDSENVLRETTKKCVDCQKKMQQGGFQFGRDVFPDPSKEIAAGINEVVKKRLSPLQASRFQEQLDKRAAHRKRVAIMNIVAKMDKDLFLSKQQRDQVTQVLTTHWKDSWGGNLQIYLQEDFQQYPTMPDAEITPLLSDQQAKVWKAVPKQDVNYWGWGGFMGAVGVIEIEGDVQGAVVVRDADLDVPNPLEVEKNAAVADKDQAPAKKPDATPDEKPERKGEAPAPPQKTPQAKDRPADERPKERTKS